MQSQPGVGWGPTCAIRGMLARSPSTYHSKSGTAHSWHNLVELGPGKGLGHNRLELGDTGVLPPLQAVILMAVLGGKYVKYDGFE